MLLNGCMYFIFPELKVFSSATWILYIVKVLFVLTTHNNKWNSERPAHLDFNLLMKHVSLKNSINCEYNIQHEALYIRRTVFENKSNLNYNNQANRESRKRSE